jgi:hypothetical protein
VGTYDEASDQVRAFRFSEAIKDINELMAWRRGVDLKVQAQDATIAQQRADLDKLVAAVDRVNGTLNKLLLTVAGSAVVFALSILGATGKL